jgi:hypothetical protein
LKSSSSLRYSIIALCPKTQNFPLYKQGSLNKHYPSLSLNLYLNKISSDLS